MHLILLEIQFLRRKLTHLNLTCVTGEDGFSDLEDFPSLSFPIDIQRQFKEILCGSLITIHSVQEIESPATILHCIICYPHQEEKISRHKKHS